MADPNTFITMSDGVQIALNVRMPNDYDPSRRYPTVFEINGYDGGTSDGDEPYAGEGSRALTRQFNDDYVTVHASVRGTGCSGGEFDLFSWRSALDGREVIRWISEQGWSNGDIGLYGHSYGGITGFMVAATQPPELDAVSVSGLIDDLYRGIVYPGGVSNYGFPLIWTGGIRNVYDIGGDFASGMDEGGAAGCAASVPQKSRTTLNDPIVQGLSDTDNTWFQARSLINYAERINIPIHISGAYQDEQTGPRGPYHLFEAVDNAPVRRLLMTNGDHGTQQDGAFLEPDRKEFIDYFVRDHGIFPGQTETVCSGAKKKRTCTTQAIPAKYDASSVVTFLENVQGESDVPAVKRNQTFPLEDTQWTDLYLQPGGGLSSTPPGADGGSDSYFSGSVRQSWNYQAGDSAGPPVTTEDAHGADEVIYATEPFTQPTAMIGPATASLFVSSTAPDTELFVQVIDEGPDGSRYFVQRGMLKASHRAIIDQLSDKLPDGTIYRPFRPHTNPTLIEPGAVYEYLVEIFPFGHVFRPGHRLIVKIHTPPAADSFYAYVAKRPVGLNTVLHDAEHPSSLMLPFVPLDGVQLGPEPAPCSLEDIRCVGG
jgi:putative CocE/NonD family hydrolase